MDLLAAWHLWIIAGLIAGALEVHLTNFVMLWFSAGAFVAALTAGLGAPLSLQLATFLVVSIGLFAASRTIFQRVFMTGASTLRVGEEALVGAEATVMEALPRNGSGTVRIHGELWAAEAIDGPITPGERVQVESVQGLRLHVRRVPPQGAITVQRSGGTR